MSVAEEERFRLDKIRLDYFYPLKIIFQRVINYPYH